MRTSMWSMWLLAVAVVVSAQPQLSELHTFGLVALFSWCFGAAMYGDLREMRL